MIYALPVSRLRFIAQTEGNLHLPEYAGSALRGAFGHALRKLTLLPHIDNTPCAVWKTCPYCQIFAVPPPPEIQHKKFSQMPAAYVIEPSHCAKRKLADGDVLTFDIVLIGRAISQLSLVVFAFEQALKCGLGRYKVPSRLLEVRHADTSEIIWQQGQNQIRDIDVIQPFYDIHKTHVTLNFITPLRLQQKGKLVDTRTLNARTFLIALARRWQLLADIHLGSQAPQLDFTTLDSAAQKIQLEPQSMRWLDWTRYSSRQKQSMTLGGLTGKLLISGDLAPFQQLLHIGQWLHVGKETAFGLGRYQLEWL